MKDITRIGLLAGGFLMAAASGMMMTQIPAEAADYHGGGYGYHGAFHDGPRYGHDRDDRRFDSAPRYRSGIGPYRYAPGYYAYPYAPYTFVTPSFVAPGVVVR